MNELFGGIGTRLRRVLRKPQNKVWDDIDRLEKKVNLYTGVGHDFLPGYKPETHIHITNTYPTTATTNQTIFIDGSTYYYDGTQWLSTEETVVYFSIENNTTDPYDPVEWRVNDSQNYVVTRWNIWTMVATTNDTSNFWWVRATFGDITGSGTAAPYIVSTNNDTADVLTDHDFDWTSSPQTPSSSKYGAIGVQADILAGSPGALTFYSSMHIRYIGA